MVLANFVTLNQTCQSSGKKESQLRKCLHQIACRQIYGAFSLLIDLGVLSSLWECHPDKLILVCLRKQAEQATRNNL